MDDMLNVLEIIFSASGAVILFLLVILSFFLLIAFNENFRLFLKGRKVRVSDGKREFEMSEDVRNPDEISNKENASIKPLEKNEDEKKLSDISAGELQESPSENDDGEMHWHIEMYVAAYSKKDPEALENAYQNLIQLKDTKFSEEFTRTLRSDLRLEMGILKGEKELQELENTHEDWVDPSLALTKYYIKISRFDLAESHVKIARERSDDDTKLAYSTSMYADVLIAQHNEIGALNILAETLVNLEDNESKAIVFEKMFDVQKLLKNNWGAANAMERAIEITPSNTDRRFKLAYHYDSFGENLLSLFHYQILSKQDATFSSALNNLGALYEKLGLPVKCVSVWRDAAEQGEAYPRANLAIRLIDNGFLNEAGSELKKIPEEKRNLERVNHAYEKLENAKKEEDKKLRKLNDATNIKYKYLTHARALESSSKTDIAFNDLVGSWFSGDNIKIDIHENEGRVFGFIEEKKENMVNALNIGNTDKKVYAIYNFELSGRILAFFAHAQKEEHGVGSLLTLGPEFKNRSYFLVVEDSKNMSGYYRSELSSPVEIKFLKQ